MGADDYLIKPFSARELITRIDTHIRLSRLRRAAIEHVKVSEERLRIAIDEAGMGTWDLDLKHQELRWSRSHYTLLGSDPDDSESRNPRRCGAVAFIPRISGWWRQRSHKSRDTQTLYSQEYRIIRADTGAVRWLRVLGRFLYDESGAPIRSVGVCFDDTDRKVAEIALRDADQRKDVFLATLAHELRNPLAPIRNAAQMLGSPKLGSEQLAVGTKRHSAPGQTYGLVAGRSFGRGAYYAGQAGTQKAAHYAQERGRLRGRGRTPAARQPRPPICRIAAHGAGDSRCGPACASPRCCPIS